MRINTQKKRKPRRSKIIQRKEYKEKQKEKEGRKSFETNLLASERGSQEIDAIGVSLKQIFVHIRKEKALGE